jgi:NDP-sugar pyrophosphorylase family protein
MRAIILAGGKGTRLKPYTHVLPKPLVPVGEKPILAILIQQLKNQGIHEITLCVNHMGELIMAYFGDGEKFGVSIEYSREENPLGTIAPLKLIKNLPENFLLMNGDLLTDLNFQDLYNFHLESNALITVGTYQRKVNIDFGIVKIEDNRISGFLEKPWYDYSVSMGVYAFNRKVLDFVPDHQFFGFDDLMLTLLNQKQEIKAYPFDGYWLDIGRPEDFDKANQDVETGIFPPHGMGDL